MTTNKRIIYFPSHMTNGGYVIVMNKKEFPSTAKPAFLLCFD